MSTETHQDIKPLSGVLAKTPVWMHPFILIARLDRPIGVWLLLLPSFWGIALAAKPQSDVLPILILFSLGAILMRAAGCIINDIWDRDIDKEVERTAVRPLASGDLSLKQAGLFLVLLLAVSLLILLQFNLTTILLGFAVLPLIVLYPVMKRITWWPQAFLGLTFNFGALMGWSAVTGDLSWQPFFLYVSGVFWTLSYDTIYAHQDIQDDAVVGVKSTARLFGEKSCSYVSGFYALSVAFAILATCGEAWWAFLPAGFYAYWQVANWDDTDAQSSLVAFQRSRIYGAFILCALLLAAI